MTTSRVHSSGTDYDAQYAGVYEPEIRYVLLVKPKPWLESPILIPSGGPAYSCNNGFYAAGEQHSC